MSVLITTVAGIAAGSPQIDIPVSGALAVIICLQLSRLWNIKTVTTLWVRGELIGNNHNQLVTWVLNELKNQSVLWVSWCDLFITVGLLITLFYRGCYYTLVSLTILEIVTRYFSLNLKTYARELRRCE